MVPKKKEQTVGIDFIILFEAGWGDFSDACSNGCPTGSLGLPWGSARLYGGG